MTSASQVPFRFKRPVECRREYLSIRVRRSLYVEGLRAFFDYYFVNAVLVLLSLASSFPLQNTALLLYSLHIAQNQ